MTLAAREWQDVVVMQRVVTVRNTSLPGIGGIGGSLSMGLPASFNTWGERGEQMHTTG